MDLFCFFLFGVFYGVELSFLLKRENRRQDAMRGKGTGLDAFDEKCGCG